MGFFKEMHRTKELLKEVQISSRFLEKEEILALWSFETRIKRVFMSTLLISALSSVFLRIFLARYRINGFKSPLIDLIVPCSLLNYHMFFEYPGFLDKYLGKSKVFYELNPEKLSFEENVETFEAQRKSLMTSYKRKFYTNSQYWH